MRKITVGAVLAVGAALALAGCGFGQIRPHAGRLSGSQAAPGEIAGVAVRSVSGQAGRLAASLARTARTARPLQGPGSPVQFRLIQYSPIVTNAGTPYPYVVFVQRTSDTRVLPSSAATLRVSFDGQTQFTTLSEQARWRAAGRPPLPHLPTKPLSASMSAGTYSFIPEGRVLTYHAAVSLPTTAAGLTREIRNLLGRSRPLSTQFLTQLGYLLAVAPLTPAGRTAAWMSVATLPGLRQCPGVTDLVGRHGSTICVSAEGHQTALVINPASGSVLAVEDRLLQSAADYPGISPGALLESATFIGGS